jgi:hypothetical protein
MKDYAFGNIQIFADLLFNELDDPRVARKLPMTSARAIQAREACALPRIRG